MMQKSNTLTKLKLISLSTLLTLGLAYAPVYSQEQGSVKILESKSDSPIEIVAQPQNYLNHKVKINAEFDKFSTLGLDYKPAFRDSQDYISFLIKREDVKDHTIPLSEMKILIKRSLAEKNMMDVETGDKIEFTGKVFSDALNDPWLEVENIKILTVKKKKADDKTKVK